MVENRPQPRDDLFQVCVLANLRAVKDPLRAALAVELLDPASLIQVVHLGREYDEGLASEAHRANKDNSRYHWLGPKPRDEALATLAQSHLLVSSSLHEGGANAVGEAIAHGIPVLAARIDGAIGLLGEDYPGYYEAGNTQALAALLRRSEVDPIFHGNLQQAVEERAPLFTPQREKESWRSLLAELGCV